MKRDAAVALRAAAQDFSADHPVIDARDSTGLARNRKLLRAAVTYAGTLPAMTKKRGYSREFTPKTERRVRFEVDRIPPTLYDRVVAKATKEGISLRALTLTLWKEWAERD